MAKKSVKANIDHQQTAIMSKPKYLYHYQVPPSFDEETHFFRTRGRITRRAFVLRLLLTLGIGAAFYLFGRYYVHEKYLQKLATDVNGQAVIYDKYFLTTYRLFNVFNDWILPALLIAYIAIQGIKRLHDTGKNGWNLIWPVYNIFLLCSRGTDDGNAFGLNPRPEAKVTYFDEIVKKTK